MVSSAVDQVTGSPPTRAQSAWFLIGCTGPERNLSVIEVDSDTFCIGRRPGVNLQLSSMRVSGKHAELLKMLRVQNAAVQISGFGWAIDDDGHADAEPQTTDPFLLETAQGFVLADIVTLRRQLLSPTTARVVEAVQSSSTLETAVDRLMRLLDIQAAAADELCRDAVAALGIHVGSRSDAESCAMGELE